MDRLTCGKCLFWNPSPHSGADLGMCQRYAPRPRWERNCPDDAPVLRFAEWPMTAEHDWCGEFAHKD